MTHTRQALKLTYQAAAKIVAAAVDKAVAISCPQCIVVVDEGGHLLAFARMDGAKFTSIDTATSKAVTSASLGAASGHIPHEGAINVGFASKSKVANLRGGLPIIIDDQLVGAIGVGSGTAEQDLDVANAGLQVLQESS